MIVNRHRNNPDFPVWRIPSSVWLLVACLLGIGAGCREQVAGPEAPGLLDACALLKNTDVDAVLGTAMGDPQARQHGNGEFWLSTCNYDVDTADGILGASLLLRPHHVVDGPVKAYADYETGLMAELGTGAALMPVDDIGDRAGWQDFGTSVGQLAVFDGPYQLILTASATANSDQLTNARQLAERVLQHLQEQ
jgi:hypothetical protein